MFEVGFSEIVLIAIVALLVVGPKEFPALVRNIGSWLGKTRHFMGAVKTEFDREINKADEIRRLMAKEAEIADLHKTLDKDRRADTVRTDVSNGADGKISTTSANTGDIAAPAPKQDHGPTQA